MFIRRFTAVLACLAMCLLAGCGQAKQKAQTDKLAESIALNHVIGEYGEVFCIKETPLAGMGIVMGLDGTGSAECPVAIKEYMIKYIQKQLNTDNRTEAIKIIESANSAIVRVNGILPEGSYENQRFDVIVEALPNTQTTSIEGGILYPCEMFETTRLGVGGAQKLAVANGPIFLDKLTAAKTNKRFAYVIGGGQVTQTSQLALGLFEQNYILASMIRNRNNQRFGDKTATAKGPALIMLSPPSQYFGEYAKFASLIRLLYLPDSDDSQKERIMLLAQQLKDPDSLKAIQAELALEAIGKTAIPSISSNLDSEDQLIQLRSARCMINLDDTRGLSTLRLIASDQNSPYRVDAVKAIAGTRRNLALETLPALLSDDNVQVKIATYESLLKLKGFSVDRKDIDGNFFYDRINTSGSNLIYAYRSEIPKLVVFGRDIQLKENIFITSTQGITINAAKGDPYVTLVKIDTKTSKVTGPLKSTYKFDDFITVLCNSPANPIKKGLGVSYSDALEIIQKLTLSESVNANFIAGRLPGE